MASDPTEKFYWKRDLTPEQREKDKQELQSETAPPASSSQSSVTVLTLPQEPRNSQKAKVVIGVPVHNGESWIAKAIIDLANFGDVVICDDGSTDHTEEIARRMKCKIIKHPKELGMSDSVTSLFLGARRIGAEVLLTLGTGSSFSAADISRLLSAVQGGECDIAIGSRFVEKAGSIEAKGQPRDEASLTRAYGKKALAMIAPPGTKSVVVEKEILPFAQQEGLQVKEYPLRTATETSAKAKQVQSTGIAKLFLRIITFATLERPLEIFGLASVVFFAAAAIEAVISLQIWLATGVKPDFGFVYSGFSLIISLILGMEGAFLFSQKTTRQKSGN